MVKLLCSPVAREPEVGEQNGDQIRTRREKLTQESLESRLWGKETMLRRQKGHKGLEVVKLLCSPVAREPKVGEKNGGQIRTQREKLTQESLESSLYLNLR